jgi:hypothetical protein
VKRGNMSVFERSDYPFEVFIKPNKSSNGARTINTLKRSILLFVLCLGLCAFVPGHQKADEVLLGQLPFTVIIHRHDIESERLRRQQWREHLWRERKWREHHWHDYPGTLILSGYLFANLVHCIISK